MIGADQPTQHLPAQMPMWADWACAVPNAFARSALFGAYSPRKGGDREALRRVKIASLHGIEMHYSGDELRQDDLDVFLQVVQLAKAHPLGDRVQFTANGMLVELGWTRNSGSYRRLTDCLERLNASSLSVTVTLHGSVREHFAGSLVRKFHWRDDGQGSPMRKWEVVLEPEIIALFGPASYTRVSWQLRLSLSPTAKWLHAYFSTHATPGPISVEKIHELSGSKVKPQDMRKFKARLKRELDCLVEKGFLESASINAANMVSVVRSPAY